MIIVYCVNIFWSETTKRFVVDAIFWRMCEQKSIPSITVCQIRYIRGAKYCSLLFCEPRTGSGYARYT